MADHASLQRVHTYCALCIARCGAIAVIENGRFTRLEPDPGHPTGEASCRRCAPLVAPPIPPCGPNACASFRCAGREKLARWRTPFCSWRPMSRPTSRGRKSTSTAARSRYRPASGNWRSRGVERHLRQCEVNSDVLARARDYFIQCLNTAISTSDYGFEIVEDRR
jgi:hypothetical protein